MPIVPPCCSQISIVSSISEAQMFEWNVLSTIQISKIFEWGVGDGPLFWFRVESVPANTCPSLNLDCGYVEVHNVLATDVDQLCERLVDMKFNKTIASVKKWSVPALQCDVEKGMRDGIDYNCPSFSDVDFCVAECMGFIPSDICISTTNVREDLAWQSMYLHLSNSLVSIGEEVQLGQHIGNLADGHQISFEPHLHFGIGDGINALGPGGGNIGQTIDMTDFYNFPAFGQRSGAAAPPGPITFNNDEIEFIRVHTRYPLGIGSCPLNEGFGSPFHGGPEYYAMDLACVTPFATSARKEVYNACGGPDITSTVHHVQDLGTTGWLVTIEHRRKATGDSFFPFAFNNNDIPPQGPFCVTDSPYTQMGFVSEPLEINKPLPRNIDMGGFFMKEILRVKHNLQESNIVKGFLIRNNLDIKPEFFLQYNDLSNSWQNNLTLKGEHQTLCVLCELNRQGDSWDLFLNVSIKGNQGKKQDTRFKIRFNVVPRDEFDVFMNFNIHTSTVSLNLPWILESNTILDEIGLFSEPWVGGGMILNLVGGL